MLKITGEKYSSIPFFSAENESEIRETVPAT